MDLEEKILEKLKGAKKIVFMGIGEDKLRDDGVGPFIITQLSENPKSNIQYINARIVPEERMEDILNFSPSHIVLIDTCTLNKPPGTVAILEKEDILNYVPISSHTIPIPIFINILEDKLKDVKIFMIGIVPKNIDLSEPLIPYKEGLISLDDYDENPELPYFEFQLSKEVQTAAESVIKIILNIINAVKI